VVCSGGNLSYWLATDINRLETKPVFVYTCRTPNGLARMTPLGSMRRSPNYFSPLVIVVFTSMELILRPCTGWTVVQSWHIVVTVYGSLMLCGCVFVTIGCILRPSPAKLSSSFIRPPPAWRSPTFRARPGPPVSSFTILV